MGFAREKQENREKILEYEAGKSPEADGRVSFYPRYLQIEHTTRCNARCIMCNHLYTGNTGAADIDLNVLYALEEALKYAEVVMLNGDGEPFLYSNIAESLSLFHKYEAAVGMNTNFTYVPDPVWDHLADDFSFLNISCDGSSRDVYESIRRGLDYDRFTENLKRLNQTAPNLRKNLDCVLMRQNLTDMENLVRFAACYGFDSVRFHSLGVNPIIGNHKDAPDLYAYALEANIEKAARAAGDVHIAAEFPEVPGHGAGSLSDDIRRMKEEEAKAGERIQSVENHAGTASHRYLGRLIDEKALVTDQFPCSDGCRWAIERCYIDIHGNMTTCCYDVSHRYGNLLEQPFMDIWNGDLYRILRMEMLKGKLPCWCRGCQWIKSPRF